MNSLSWLLYFAGIAGPLSSALNQLAVIMLLGFAAAVVAGLITYASTSTSSYDDEDDRKTKAQIRGVVNKYAKILPKWLALPLICMVVSSVIPPKETLYLIAASEVGEQVVTSPTMTKAIDALNRLLDGVAVKKPAQNTPAT